MPLVFAFVAFVGSATTSGSVGGSFATSGSVPGSGIGSSVGILSKCIIRNNMLLKLLRLFFPNVFIPSKCFNSLILD